MSLARFLLVLVVPTLSIIALAQQPAKTIVFNADTDSVSHFVDLPTRALSLLTSDKEDFPDGAPADLHCSDRELQRSSLPGGWKDQILCTSLPLSTEPGRNYLVIGVGALRGAHIVPLWIFHQDDRGVSLIFKTRSDAIRILGNSSKSYREIESVWDQQAGAIVFTDRYGFNGRVYARYSSSESHH